MRSDITWWTSLFFATMASSGEGLEGLGITALDVDEVQAALLNQVSRSGRGRVCRSRVEVVSSQEAHSGTFSHTGP